LNARAAGRGDSICKLAAFGEEGAPAVSVGVILERAGDQALPSRPSMTPKQAGPDRQSSGVPCGRRPKEVELPR
jgi:hypothetical protein